MRKSKMGLGAAALAGFLAMGCERSESKKGAPAGGAAPAAGAAAPADEGRKHEGESMSGMNTGASGSAARAGAAADGTGAVDGAKGIENPDAPEAGADARIGMAGTEDTRDARGSTYDSVLPRDSVATLSGQDRAVRAGRPESENTTGARFEIASMSGEEVVLRPLDETTDANRDNVAGYEVTMPRAEFDTLVGTVATPARTGLRLTLTRDGTGKARSITLE